MRVGMTTRLRLIGCVGVVLLVLAGCVIVDRPVGLELPPGDLPPGGLPPIAVPPGHLPPPGLCRIWFPGTPPGQQPPPGECWALQGQVPPGAVLIRGR